MVDPGLQRGGDREIIHGHRQHDDLGGLDLRDQGIGQSGGLLLAGAAGLGGGRGGRQRGEAEMRHGLRGQVALHHHRAGMGAAPALDELAGDQAGLRALAEQAGGDEEKLGHGAVLVMPRGMRPRCGKGGGWKPLR